MKSGAAEAAGFFVVSAFVVSAIDSSAPEAVSPSGLRLGVLRKRKDFRAAARGGVHWRGQALRLQARRRTSRVPAHPRIGYTATKRTIGNAVQRNRARRRLRAAVADCETTQFVAGIDYVVLALPACLSLSVPHLTAELQTGLASLARRLERMPR